MTRMHQTQLRFEPLILDYFAGGGGASEGIRSALGRCPDVAINHDLAAITMHATNHPDTLHLRENVWDVDPRRDLPPGPVTAAWFSPSCTHFSRARGSKPLSKQLRCLPWVAARLAKHRRPDVVFLENVAEMMSWGPIDARGRALPGKSGETWRRFLRRFRALGYVVEHRVLDAADYGAPTHRKRLVMIARRDGLPILWPEPTHGPGRPMPYRTAAECIDWTIPCPSIFDRDKPLVPATQRRIARGVQRFILDAKRPFLIDMPDGKAAAFFAQKGQGERAGQAPRIRSVERPYSTIVAGGNKQWLVAAFLAKHNGGTIGQSVTEPTHTITAKDTKRAVAVLLTKYYATGSGASVAEPLHTQTTRARFGLVAAFLTKFYGTSTGASVEAPAPTITGQGGHLGVVTVRIDGEDYAIADIGMRMLSPRELARCQGFPDSYVLTGTQGQQIDRIGNSVSPPMARAVVAANVGARKKERAA